MKRIKLIAIFSLLITAFVSVNVKAEEDNKLVCYYVENCEGELEYVCVDPNEVSPCQIGCPPGCEGDGD